MAATVEGSKGGVTARRYQIGLGKLSQDSTLHENSPLNQEKLLLVKAEQELESKELQERLKRNKNFYERVINSNRNTTKSLQDLYAMCESLSTTLKDSLQLPEIASCRQSTISQKRSGSLKDSQNSTMLPNITQCSNYQLSLCNSLLTERREPVRSKIEKSREILLVKLAVQDRLKETNRMKEYIERKEALLKLNKELYDQDKQMIDDYINYAKRDAVLQKVKSYQRFAEREQLETRLGELKSYQILLKKEIEDNKEKYRTLVEYKNFMLILDPELKRAMSKKFFMTEHDGDSEVKRVKDNPMIKDLEDEFGLNPDDSDTEFPVKFSSSKEVVDILDRIELDNLGMINELQKRKEELENIRRQAKAKLIVKKARLDKVKEDVQQAKVEELKKKEHLEELKKSIYLITEEEQKSKAVLKEEEVKREIEYLIKEICQECLLYKKVKDSKQRTLIQQLELITNFLMKLKEIRTYKINKALRVSKKELTDLLKSEDEEKKRENERALVEKNKMIAEELERKRSEASKWDNVTRTKKTMREMMRRARLNSVEKKVVIKEEEEVDDMFNDKYFI